MPNNLPEIAQHSNRTTTNETVTHKLSQTPPKINFKGITLRQYFRICDEPRYQQTIKEDEGESQSSAKQSIVQTPCFGQDDTKRRGRSKIKTEICDEGQNQFKNNIIRQHFPENEYPRACYPNNIEKGRVYNPREGHPFQKKKQVKKTGGKMHSQSTKQAGELLNTTLSSWNQLDNKRRMLRKTQADRERANDLRLSDAFFITKYGARFLVDKLTHRNDQR